MPRMNVFDAIVGNVAVREFRPDIIREEYLKRILEAARLTQSAKNQQPWTFVVIKDRQMLNKLADLMTGDMDEGIMNKAPMAVAIVGDPVSEFYLFDLGRVTQSMTLAAWELGIGSVIISGPEPPDRENYRVKAGELIGVPKNLHFRELIIFGYPAVKKEVRRKQRKKYQDIVFEERFGSPESK
ncbi:MAG: nitroreductase family protein [Candidatus Bathyarchaeia archaeon]